MNSRTRLVSLLVLAAAALQACTTTSQTSLGLIQDDRYYIGDKASRTVDRDYIDRYVCAAGVPLKCRCTSMISASCDCRC
jgi:hypothetical protein